MFLSIILDKLSVYINQFCISQNIKNERPKALLILVGVVISIIVAVQRKTKKCGHAYKCKYKNKKLTKKIKKQSLLEQIFPQWNNFYFSPVLFNIIVFIKSYYQQIFAFQFFGRFYQSFYLSFPRFQIFH